MGGIEIAEICYKYFQKIEFTFRNIKNRDVDLTVHTVNVSIPAHQIFQKPRLMGMRGG